MKALISTLIILLSVCGILSADSEYYSDKIKSNPEIINDTYECDGLIFRIFKLSFDVEGSNDNIDAGEALDIKGEGQYRHATVWETEDLLNSLKETIIFDIGLISLGTTSDKSTMGWIYDYNRKYYHYLWIDIGDLNENTCFVAVKK